jgi:hypothetical protein
MRIRFARTAATDDASTGERNRLADAFGLLERPKDDEMWKHFRARTSALLPRKLAFRRG